MTSLNASLPSRFGREYLPISLLLRIGKREIRICRDFRSRYYKVAPLLECNVGMERGHLEILLLRKWLLVFTKAC